ncbi:FAD-dependent oxidoreductase [Actinophytocola oryzae]|uniref:2-polyprenyl-6-methoxyphenol hydroxylase-like FAD-dependent oxidoreductase n=1 Tax=Actinophytocola oryzae TaxID=502181 RepID=A0A4R7VKE5_9PSEU|nr:NAD(P)/FAD-dependent oxidoreductase [Actinophytocola oryzae]TDV49956.1 2-polyprenyl-6-methoxyphenol hydroxylase-like FAD-dependent oxidoreductase [Actinophytocola oryzae]
MVNKFEPRWDQALVIGSSIAGLAVARVLADHFHRVVLVERDSATVEATGRGGVPQSRHVHGLLAAGGGMLEELFPGLRAELADAGAPVYDFGEATAMFIDNGRLPLTTTGLMLQSFSRGLLESRLRRRVAELPQVRIEAGATVTGLLTDHPNGPVTGITVARHSDATDTEGGTDERYRADLVVDCSGRFTKLPQWLTAIGYPRPAETIVDAGLAYASRMYDGPPRSWNALLHPVQAHTHPCGAYAARIEGNRWMVSLLGVTPHHPPTDDAEYAAFAAGLNNPELSGLLAESRPITPIHRFTRIENRRFELARMRRWPDRLLVMGDAHCAFNPVYGQGMTVAIASALALREQLRQRRGSAHDLTGLAPRVHRRLRRVTFYPWMMSTNEDAIWSAARTDTRAGRIPSAAHWFQNRLFRSMMHHEPSLIAFQRVFNSVKPPTHLLTPHILVRALTPARSDTPTR